MKRTLLALVMGAIVALAPAMAVAQEAPEEPEVAATVDIAIPPENVNSDEYPLVVVRFTLPVELADQAEDLSTTNFFIGENDESREFSLLRYPAEELAVVLVFDTSGSMNEGTALADAKAAVSAFVETMPEDVPIALIGFGNEATVLVDFDEDQNAVVSAIDGIVAGGDTAFYDAVTEASELIAPLEGTRKSIIVLTDGGDTASTASLEEAMIELIGSEAEFVVVELQTSENDPDALGRLLAATNGQRVPADDPAAFAGIYEELASDLLNEFEASFVSQSSGATEVQVAVIGDGVRAQGATQVTFPDAPVVPPTEAPVESTPTPAEAEDQVVAVPELEGTTVVLPWYETDTALWLGAAAIFLGLFGIFALVRPAKVSGGVEALRGMSVTVRPNSGVLSGMADRAAIFAEEAIARTGRAGGVRLLLDQAGLNLRVGEYGVVLLAAGLAGFLGGYLWLGILGGVGFAVGAMIIPFLVVSAMAARRARAFAEQLADTLQLVAGGLKAGFGLMQAIDAMTTEAAEPTAAEFKRIQLEVQLGRNLDEAIQSAADRVRSEDLQMAGEAIQIHQQVGGDLAQLLERVAGTIREREMVRRQIQVLSAEGRLSAIVLIALPIVIAVIVSVVAPNYLSVLTESTAGQAMILGAIVAMIIGIFWIRRIVKLEY